MRQIERIKNLYVKNVARVSEVVFEPPEQGLIVVGGKNKAGKTTLINSIFAGLGGKPPELRDGEKTGRIELELEEYNVTLFLGITNKLKVTAKRSNKNISSPKALLKGILGKRAFDVTNFLSSQPRQQIDTLLSIIDIPSDIDKVVEICENKVNKDDLSSLPLEYMREAYDSMLADQRSISRRVKTLEDTCTFSSVVEKVDLEPLYALKSKAQDAETLRVTIDNKRDRGIYLKDKKTSFEKEIKDFRARIIKLEQNINDINNDIETVRSEYTELADQYREIEVYRLQDITEEISKALEQNKLYEQEQQNRLKRQEYTSAIDEKEKVKEILQNLKQYKLNVMAETVFPVPGLDIREGQIFYNNHPLKSASGAEQMLVATAIARSEIPQDGLQALFILDPPQLDSDSWSTLEKFAEKEQVQIWIAKVEEEQEQSSIFLIEGVQE